MYDDCLLWLAVILYFYVARELCRALLKPANLLRVLRIEIGQNSLLRVLVPEKKWPTLDFSAEKILSPKGPVGGLWGLGDCC